MDRARLIKLGVALLVPLVVLLIPREAIPIDGLTVTQHRTVAIFALALCLWVLEPIPIFATSVLVIVVSLMTISDRSVKWLLPPEGTAPEVFGELVPYRSIMATFADPIIMLFLGGFFLGAAATKYRLDTNLGRVLLKPFGTRTAWVMLGMMAITAVFSMFMSNTATTAMMLAVLMPVLKSIDADDPARISFALAIPFAANVGGIGTPIGTPPNAVGMKYLVDADGQPLVTFAGWMGFGLPFVVVLLVLAWLLLLLMFRPSKPRLEVEFRGRWMRSGQAWVVYVTSAATIGLWLTGGTVHGMTSHTVALIPVAVFCCTGIMTSQDLKGLSWDVLWLVAGGFALGLALSETGLSGALVESIPFETLPALLIVGIAVVLTYLMATFMSNTAAANLVLPIMAALGASLSSLAPLGGQMMLILVVTFSASLAMTMPISTPPNAMAYATGWIKTGHMAKAGTAVGLLGLGLTAAMAVLMNLLGFFDR
ncbi:MAG: SLC13 family permease [Planctomycetota bacterium]